MPERKGEREPIIIILEPIAEKAFDALTRDLNIHTIVAVSDDGKKKFWQTDQLRKRPKEIIGRPNTIRMMSGGPDRITILIKK